jgi:hypothetical protein
MVVASQEEYGARGGKAHKDRDRRFRTSQSRTPPTEDRNFRKEGGFWMQVCVLVCVCERVKRKFFKVG